jgi:hypothetical protein
MFWLSLDPVIHAFDQRAEAPGDAGHLMVGIVGVVDDQDSLTRPATVIQQLDRHIDRTSLRSVMRRAAVDLHLVEIIDVHSSSFGLGM